MYIIKATVLFSPNSKLLNLVVLALIGLSIQLQDLLRIKHIITKHSFSSTLTLEIICFVGY